MEINRRLEHTLLKPDATEGEIAVLCREAREFRFQAVVVNPVYIGQAVRLLHDSDTNVGTVAGFPLGATPTAVKRHEVALCLEDGAAEIDLVANIGWLKDRKFDLAADEISAVREIVPHDAILKVIVELSLLPKEFWAEAVEVVVSGQADYIKSGTGFFGPVTAEQIAKLNRLVAGRLRIKAAGAIRTYAGAEALLKAGADRLGSSASTAIMREWREHSKK